MSTVLLVRHGETHWNRKSRVQGWAATELTDRGHEQARTLGAWLDHQYDVDRVIASDLERTRQTTAGIREAATGIPDPIFEDTLRERGFGVYQGFLAEELVAQFPEYNTKESLLTLDTDPINGESVGTFIDRVEQGWERVAGTVGDGETALVVTHGGVLKLFRAILTERDRQTTLSQASPPNCSVTEVRFDGGSPALVDYGATPWRE